MALIARLAVGVTVLLLAVLWHQVFQQVCASSTVNLPQTVPSGANLALTLLSYLPDFNQDLFVQSYYNLTSFRHFDLLPRELRFMIWRATMPRGRRFPLESFRRNQPRFLGPRPPVLYNVCQESRKEVLQHFIFLRWTVHWVQGPQNPTTTTFNHPLRTMQLLFDPITDILTSKLIDHHDPSRELNRGYFMFRQVQDSFRSVRVIEVLRVQWCHIYDHLLNGRYVLAQLTGLWEIRIVRPAKLLAPGACLTCPAITRECKVSVVAWLLRMQFYRDARIPPVLPRVNIYEYFEPRHGLPAPAVDNLIPGEE